MTTATTIPQNTRDVPQKHRLRSHPALLQQLARAARGAFAGAEQPWDPDRDRREAPDLGRGLLDVVAVPLHVLWTYQEAWAREGFLSTATLDASRQRLLDLVATPQTPGLAGTGLQRFVLKPGRETTLPPEFRLTAPARGARKAAEFETLAAASLSHARNAFLPFLPAGPPLPPSDGTIAYSAALLAPEVSVPGPQRDVKDALERRLAAGFAGDIARRNADRQRARALQRAETLRELQDTGAIDPFSAAFQDLCAGVCAAQQLANEVPADAAVGPLSESQEMLLGQLGKIARRQPLAMAGLNEALAAQDGENDADYSHRLDQTTGFLDALVNGLMQDARDQMGRLHGPGRFALLDQKLSGAGTLGTTPDRGFAARGTNTVFLLSGLDPDSGAEVTQSAHVNPGDWLVVAQRGTITMPDGTEEETTQHREAVQVVRVGEDLPAGQARPMTQITFRPGLSRGYRLTDLQLLGNNVLISHGRTIKRRVTRGQIGRDGLKLTDEPLTWLPDPRADSGRRTQVALRIAGQDWAEVPIAALADAPPGAFFLTIDAEGVARLLIGAGDFDAPIPMSAQIDISYRVGGGAEGNRAATAVNALANADSAIAATFNPLPIDGGTVPETAAQARDAGIAASILDRAVTLGDVRRLALNYGSVTRANVRRFRRRGAVVEARERLEVVVSGVEGAMLTPVELDALGAFLRARVAPGIVLSLTNRQTVPIMARLKLLITPGADPLEVMGTARQRLGFDKSDTPGWLDPACTDLGHDLHLSDLHGSLSGLPGLNFLHVLAFHRADQASTRADRIAVAPNALPVWSGRVALHEPLELLWEEAVDL